MNSRVLSPDAQQAWSEYLKAEEIGVKHLRDKALNDFLAMVGAETPEAIYDFVASWCVLTLDNQKSPTLGNGAPTRAQLLTDLIGPSLIEAYQACQPNSARWLAQISTYLPAKSASAQSVRRLGDRWELLQTALERDPTDDRARLLIVSLLLSDIDYDLHELPHLITEKADTLSSLSELVRYGPPVLEQRALECFVSAVRTVVDDPSDETKIDAYLDARIGNVKQ